MDPVSRQHSLVPVDAARHILAFTQILHGVDLSKCHKRCLKQSERWLGDIRRNIRSIRMTGIDRGLLEVWTRLLIEAHEKIQAELLERPHRAMVPGAEVRRVIRRAMDAVGWEDFGLETNARGDRAVITFPERHRKKRQDRRPEFEARLCRQLGADFDLRVSFRRLVEDADL